MQFAWLLLIRYWWFRNSGTPNAQINQSSLVWWRPLPSMICWTLFLKTFLDHVSATGFCWKCFLDMCVGHVSRRQFFTINIWDMFFGQQSEKVTQFENRTATTPYENHIENTTTRTPPQRKHGRSIHFHLLRRILSLTHLFRLICSPTNLYPVFFLPGRSCKLPKIYLPTCCYL